MHNKILVQYLICTTYCIYLYTLIAHAYHTGSDERQPLQTIQTPWDLEINQYWYASYRFKDTIEVNCRLNKFATSRPCMAPGNYDLNGGINADNHDIPSLAGFGGCKCDNAYDIYGTLSSKVQCNSGSWYCTQLSSLDNQFINPLTYTMNQKIRAGKEIDVICLHNSISGYMCRHKNGYIINTGALPNGVYMITNNPPNGKCGTIYDAPKSGVRFYDSWIPWIQYTTRVDCSYQDADIYYYDKCAPTGASGVAMKCNWLAQDFPKSLSDTVFTDSLFISITSGLYQYSRYKTNEPPPVSDNTNPLYLGGKSKCTDMSGINIMNDCTLNPAYSTTVLQTDNTGAVASSAIFKTLYPAPTPTYPNSLFSNLALQCPSIDSDQDIYRLSGYGTLPYYMKDYYNFCSSRRNPGFEDIYEGECDSSLKTAIDNSNYFPSSNGIFRCRQLDSEFPNPPSGNYNDATCVNVCGLYFSGAALSEVRDFCRYYCAGPAVSGLPLITECLSRAYPNPSFNDPSVHPNWSNDGKIMNSFVVHNNPNKDDRLNPVFIERTQSMFWTHVDKSNCDCDPRKEQSNTQLYYQEVPIPGCYPIDHFCVAGHCTCNTDKSQLVPVTAPFLYRYTDDGGITYQTDSDNHAFVYATDHYCVWGDPLQDPDETNKQYPVVCKPRVTITADLQTSAITTCQCNMNSGWVGSRCELCDTGPTGYIQKGYYIGSSGSCTTTCRSPSIEIGHAACNQFDTVATCELISPSLDAVHCKCSAGFTGEFCQFPVSPLTIPCGTDMPIPITCALDARFGIPLFANYICKIDSFMLTLPTPYAAIDGYPVYVKITPTPVSLYNTTETAVNLYNNPYYTSSIDQCRVIFKEVRPTTGTPTLLCPVPYNTLSALTYNSVSAWCILTNYITSTEPFRVFNYYSAKIYMYSLSAPIGYSAQNPNVHYVWAHADTTSPYMQLDCLLQLNNNSQSILTFSSITALQLNQQLILQCNIIRLPNIDRCIGNFTNCGPTIVDPVCRDTYIDIHNCGGCEIDCLTNNVASATCTDGLCSIFECTMSYTDCDGLASNGCESNLLVDAGHCGTCGNICNLPNAISSCTAGNCTILSCTGGFSDCNGVASDGCETTTTTNSAHCGSCGNTCTQNTACINSVCNCCAYGYADCNSNLVDGCETYLFSGSQPTLCGGGFGGSVCFQQGGQAYYWSDSGTMRIIKCWGPEYSPLPFSSIQWYTCDDNQFICNRDIPNGPGCVTFR
jgi:hypothetical protein